MKPTDRRNQPTPATAGERTESMKTRPVADQPQPGHSPEEERRPSLADGWPAPPPSPRGRLEVYQSVIEKTGELHRHHERTIKPLRSRLERLQADREAERVLERHGERRDTRRLDYEIEINIRECAQAEAHARAFELAIANEKAEARAWPLSRDDRIVAELRGLDPNKLPLELRALSRDAHVIRTWDAMHSIDLEARPRKSADGAITIVPAKHGDGILVNPPPRIDMEA
jgi:hypothetical protein